jgi:hypothetical protein
VVREGVHDKETRHPVRQISGEGGLMARTEVLGQESTVVVQEERNPEIGKVF